MTAGLLKPILVPELIEDNDKNCLSWLMNYPAASSGVSTKE
jgi:hypothetical protein